MTTITQTQTTARNSDQGELRRRKSSIGFPWTYIRLELLATAKQPEMSFFCIVMPIGMYLLFGKMNNFETMSAGHGNITAYVMSEMAVYSVAVAATSAAGSAATDLAGGWGRQLALTAGGLRAYITTKIVAAIVTAAVPLLLVHAAGGLTGAHIDSPGRWAACLALAFLTAIPAAAFGLAVGLWMRSQRAIGIAASSLAIFAFLGNVFVPLSGVLFRIAHYTPLYGANALALRPIAGSTVNTMDGSVTEPLWYSVTNLVVWTLLFTAACLAASRRQTARR